MVYRLWGRANSANVVKVIWALLETSSSFERIDAGLEFGVVETPEFRSQNPNGLVPVLEDGPFAIWESNAILRYIARSRSEGECLYPPNPKGAAIVDQWMDWQQSRIYGPMGLLFVSLVREGKSPFDPDVNDLSKQCISVSEILNRRLGDNKFVAGPEITLADIALAPFLRRHLVLIGEARSQAEVSNILRWIRSLSGRPAFLQAIAGDALPHPDWLLGECS